MEIKENMILKYRDGKMIRIVFNDRLSSIIYAIDLESNRLAYPIEKDLLLSQYEAGDPDIADSDPFYRYVTDDELSKAETKRREHTWKIVMFVFEQLEHEQQIFVSKYREKVIQSAVTIFQVSRNTVKNYLIKYWKGGKNRNALLPSFHLCGARGQERSD